MARKKKMKKTKSRYKKGSGKSNLMPLAVGAIIGNIANNIVVKFGSSIPMISSISPVAIGLLANYMKSDYSNGMIAASAVNLMTSIGRQYLPASVSELVAGEEYVIQGAEGSDPLLGADYLYGEENMSMDELGQDEFVVSGASNDPLD
jgi:hypothetical protein